MLEQVRAFYPITSSSPLRLYIKYSSIIDVIKYIFKRRVQLEHLLRGLNLDDDGTATLLYTVLRAYALSPFLTASST